MTKTKKETTRNQQKSRPREAKADGESAVLAKIAEMPGPDRALAKRLHAVIKATRQSSRRNLVRDARVCQGRQVVCFFRGADKFKERYMTLGFNDAAKLDDGHLWPIAFALTELTGAERARIGAAREESSELRT